MFFVILPTYAMKVVMNMRLSSHMLISDITADIIQELTDIKINKRMMRLGSIMPDILPHRRKQLHLPSKVAEHYKKELARTIQRKRKMNRISFVLGLLTHYITDAFCLSHNVYVVNLKKHIQYEYLLNDFKHQYAIPDDIMDKIDECVKALKDHESDADMYIQEMNKKYLEVIRKDDWMANIEHDMEQAIIHVSTLLSEFLMELKNEELVYSL